MINPYWALGVGTVILILGAIVVWANEQPLPRAPRHSRRRNGRHPAHAR